MRAYKLTSVAHFIVLVGWAQAPPSATPVKKTVVRLDSRTGATVVPIFPLSETGPLAVRQTQQPDSFNAGDAEDNLVEPQKGGRYLVRLTPAGLGKFEYEVGPPAWDRIVWRIVAWRPDIEARLVDSKPGEYLSSSTTMNVVGNAPTKLVLENRSQQRPKRTVRWRLRVGSHEVNVNEKTESKIEFDGPGERLIDLGLTEAVLSEAMGGKTPAQGIPTSLTLLHDDTDIGEQVLSWTTVWRPSPPGGWTRVGAFVWALLGVLASYLTGFCVPNMRRKSDLKKSLTELARRIRDIPGDLGPELEAELRSQRLALDAKRESVSSFWPSYSQVAAELVAPIENLTLRVGLAGRLARLRLAVQEILAANNFPLSRYNYAMHHLHEATGQLLDPAGVGPAEQALQKAASFLALLSPEDAILFVRSLEARIESILKEPPIISTPIDQLLALLDASTNGLKLDNVRDWVEKSAPTQENLKDWLAAFKDGEKLTGEQLRTWLSKATPKFPVGIAPLLAELHTTAASPSGEELRAWIEQKGTGAIDTEVTLLETWREVLPLEGSPFQLATRPTIAVASATLHEMKQRKCAAVEASIRSAFEKKQAKIRLDREAPRVNEAIGFSLEFEEEPLNLIAPQTTLIPIWTFKLASSEAEVRGWKVIRFFIARQITRTPIGTFNSEAEVRGWKVTRFFTKEGAWTVKVRISRTAIEIEEKQINITKSPSREKSWKQFAFIAAGVLPVLITLVWQSDDLSFPTMVTAGFTVDKLKEAIAGKES